MFATRQSFINAASYQLWLNDLGKNPDAVLNFLKEDMFIDEAIARPADFPTLPWMMIELPAGSDTYSIVHMKAGDLMKLGANVSVREVKPFMKKVLSAAFIFALVLIIAFAFIMNSARLELREMHEHEVQESLISQ